MNNHNKTNDVTALPAWRNLLEGEHENLVCAMPFKMTVNAKTSHGLRAVSGFSNLITTTRSLLSKPCSRGWRGTAAHAMFSGEKSAARGASVPSALRRPVGDL
jgi:glucose-6-phosphate isomerase